MSDTLKKCPVCGGFAEDVMRTGAIVCIGCHASAVSKNDWNTRVTPKVRPLVWVDEFGDGSQYVGCKASLGYHDRISRRPSGKFHYMGELFDKLDEAMAEAEKCFTAAVLSALDM